ncbi:hypothetical protein D3C85_1853250 [compost metagenome]
MLFSGDDVETLSFKPDLGPDERRFDHGLRIERQQFQVRHRAFVETIKALRTLEERLDDAD